MEKIYDNTLSEFFYNDFIIVELIRWLDLVTLYELKLISKSVKAAIENENYALFMKIRDYLNLPTTFYSSDLISKYNVEDIFKRAVAASKQEATLLSPFAYFTDGGVDTNSNYYFLQNVWKKTGIWYCTTANNNIHVQSILSKTIDLPTAENNPMKFLESKKNKLRIRIPIEKYIIDNHDNFHFLKNFQIHLRSGGYNAYVESFAVFYSEYEIDNVKFHAYTKKFTKVNKVSDLPALKLKVHNKEEDKKWGIKIVEFDVSKTRHIDKWFKTRDSPIYPLLWIHIRQKYVNTTINYKIRQRVAAKFISLKLLKSSNTSSTCNIDLYNLGIKGVPLDLSTPVFE